MTLHAKSFWAEKGGFRGGRSPGGVARSRHESFCRGGCELAAKSVLSRDSERRQDLSVVAYAALRASIREGREQVVQVALGEGCGRVGQAK
jgi:hypothetical protein